MCSPWRGGWEVRGAPLTSSVPHRPERHIKPQCKHKGISQNEFISKPHLVVTMVPEHSVPEGLVQPMEELFVRRVKQPEAGPESAMALPGPCVCTRIEAIHALQ